MAKRSNAEVVVSSDVIASEVDDMVKRVASADGSVVLRPVSPDTVEKFREFLETLGNDNTFDPEETNEIREGARAYDESKVIPALANIATYICRQIREREKRLASFADQALSNAHDIFEVVRRNPISMGELMARLGAKHGLHASQEGEYQEKLEALIEAEPAQFQVIGTDVYRKRHEDGTETGVEMPSASAPRKGSKAKAKKGAKTGTKNPEGPARGRYVNNVKEALGVQELTSKQQSSIVEALGGVKLNKATKTEIKKAAQKAGVI